MECMDYIRVIHEIEDARRPTHLDVERLVLVRHYQRARDIPAQRPRARRELRVERAQARTHTVPEAKHGVEGGPVLVSGGYD